MAFPSLQTSPKPSASFSLAGVTQVRQAQFGDGYMQESGQDLNSVRDKLFIAWDGISGTSKTSLIDFFKARKGAERFTYQPPDSDSPLTWICSQWNAELTRPGPDADKLWRVTATFEQRFDVG